MVRHGGYGYSQDEGETAEQPQRRPTVSSPRPPRNEQENGTVSEWLRRVRDAVIQPPRPSDDTAGDQFIIRRLLVAEGGVPARGPNIAIPRGFPVVVRMRTHVGSPVGYIAGSQAAVRSTDSRAELSDNDAITLHVSNLNQIWADSDSNNVSFELIVEQ